MIDKGKHYKWIHIFIAFDLVGNIYLKTNLIDINNKTNAEFISILKFIFNDLGKPNKRVIANPKHNVETIEVFRSGLPQVSPGTKNACPYKAPGVIWWGK